MPTTRPDLHQRLTSLCVGAGYTRSVTPFDFDQQPTGLIDGNFRIEIVGESPVGGFNLSEVRNDRVSIWIARKHKATPWEAYYALEADCTSLTSHVVRDGITDGDYSVPDGTTATIEHENGREFAVARLNLPLNYEAVL